jgi:hypothetical protein
MLLTPQTTELASQVVTQRSAESSYTEQVRFLTPVTFNGFSRDNPQSSIRWNEVRMTALLHNTYEATCPSNHHRFLMHQKVQHCLSSECLRLKLLL